MQYPGEKIRPEDPDYWTLGYAFWSMRRHPGMAAIMFVLWLVLGTVLGSLVALPLLLLRGWIGRDAIELARGVLTLLGVAYGIYFGVQLCCEPFWWRARRRWSRFR